MIGCEGTQGIQGEAGADGKSAYQLAVEKGYTGTVEEWLVSLAGEAGVDGKNGSNGADGKAGESAYEIAVRLGYEGTEQEWLSSLVGKTGPRGSSGSSGNTGKSAYELACDNGFEGSLTEWLASLVGKDGAAAAKGDDGKSAYELACDNGFEGSLTEWLTSLIGEKGDTGAQGPQGEKGEKGDTGAQGPQGEKGDKGDTGAQGPQGEQGDKGDTGAQGPQGEQGEKGDTGAQGPQGEQGEKGDTGAQGPQGEQGEKGDTGAQGPQGEQGEKGDTGAQGPQGEQGEKGDTGAQGPQGEKGEKGDTGAQGPQGEQGEKGDTGAQGPQGEKGEKGDTGAQGPQGEKGDNGLSAYEIYKKNNPDYTGTEAEWIEAYITGTLIEYTITFDLNGGTGAEGFEQSITANYGKTIQLTIPTRTGYTFLGWFTGESVIDGIFTTTNVVTGNLDLIARWRINEHTVTFLDYYGDVIDIQTVNYGEAAIAPAVPSSVLVGGVNVPFQGWNQTFNAVTKNMVISAIYSRDIYTVSYNTDGAPAITAEGVYYGELPTRPEDPEKAGATFVGWFLERSFQTEYNFDYALNVNTTLYAKFNGDYIFITTAEELTAIADDPTIKYVLGNDINYMGDVWEPIETFSGTLDGNGYRIYNFTLSSSSENQGFVKTNSGTIKNIIFDEFTVSVTYNLANMLNEELYAGVVAANNEGFIDNCTLKSGTINYTASLNKKGGGSGTAYFGGIAGANMTGKTISNCENLVDMSVNISTIQQDSSGSGTLKNIVWLGGIAGANSGTIEKSFVENSIACTATVQNKIDGTCTLLYSRSYSVAGGITGENLTSSSVVKECQVNSNITFTYSGSSKKSGYLTKEMIAGALVGRNYGSIDNCLAQGSITSSNTGDSATMLLGGAVGRNMEDAAISNSFSSVNVSTGSGISYYSAGFVSDNQSGAKVIKSVSVGNVNAGANNTGYGLFAAMQSGTLNLCYYSNSATLTKGGSTAEATCTAGEAKGISELQGEDFIYNTLYWDEDVWIAVEGQNPTLNCFVD